MDYQQFVSDKLRMHHASGIDPGRVDEHALFPHQAAIVKWAARKGRAAIFADTGLGKTRMQLVWADAIHAETGHDCLILAPLAVAEQTRMEGDAIGISVTHARSAEDIREGINITNYDRLHRFDPAKFGAVVLDESSIIKHHDAKTLGVLMAAFRNAPYRLCATATPAPNDWTELGTHAEFLGICSRAEMLSEYFTHDGGETQKWRLKGHARSEFWRWVASWGAMIRSPADLGMDASAYALPPLHVEQITVESDAVPAEGQLFALEALTLSDRRQARRNSMSYRVDACADLVNEISEPWIVWCELNAEGDALRQAIPDAVEVRGSDTAEEKERALVDFAAGRIRVLITKPKIAGFGLNWQHCRRIAFVGVSDSFEAYYQAIRRCWRFGQRKAVYAYLFVSEQEGAVRKNLERKETAAKRMFDDLSLETSAAVRDEIIGQKRMTNEYAPSKKISLPSFFGART
jgi:superfamily II DNA or RNA helicase